MADDDMPHNRRGDTDLLTVIYQQNTKQGVRIERLSVEIADMSTAQDLLMERADDVHQRLKTIEERNLKEVAVKEFFTGVWGTLAKGSALIVLLGSLGVWLAKHVVEDLL